jgi:hypothetical protein
VAVKLVYAYALALFLAFASSLAALIFYIRHDYYGTVVSALIAGSAYLATRVILLLISRKE